MTNVTWLGLFYPSYIQKTEFPYRFWYRFQIGSNKWSIIIYLTIIINKDKQI